MGMFIRTRILSWDFPIQVDWAVRDLPMVKAWKHFVESSTLIRESALHLSGEGVD